MPTIKIEIGRSRPTPPLRRLHRGVLHSNSHADYMSRRRKAIVDINFYDLGQFAGGSDIPFSTATAVTLDGKGYPTSAANFTAASWQALIDSLDVPGASGWGSVYRRIDSTRLDKFDLTFAGRDGVARAITTGSTYTIAADGIEYNGSVLRCDSRIAFRGIGSTLCAQLAAVDDADLKITATASSAAPAVPFNLRKNTDFFLLPRIGFELGQSGLFFFTDIGGVGYGTFRTGILNLLFKQISREVYLDGSFAHGTNQTITDNALAAAAAANIKTDLSARYFVNTTQTDPADSSHTIAISNSMEAPSTFPDLSPPGTPGQVIQTNAVRWRSASAGAFNANFPLSYTWFSIAGEMDNVGHLTTGMDSPASYQLIAVAKQGSNIFYFWNLPASYVSRAASAVTKTLIGSF
jgi:hypothetical protein